MSNVSVSRAAPQGMVTLKGDLKAMAPAIKSVVGAAVPDVRGMNGKVAWMAPDEVLVLCDHNKADAVVGSLEAKLKGTHFLALNVSDARAVFTLEGADLRDVLARLSPADLRDLTPGQMRRTRLSQVPAAFWMTSDTTAQVVCFRSVAVYVEDLLTGAARSAAQSV